MREPFSVRKNLGVSLFCRSRQSLSLYFFHSLSSIVEPLSGRDHPVLNFRIVVYEEVSLDLPLVGGKSLELPGFLVSIFEGKEEIDSMTTNFTPSSTI